MDALAALALLGSGVISTAGSLYANAKNIDLQKHVNDVNWQMAAMNNATQIDMANTAHQREVADLRAAGLNPILSAGGNGAAVPSLQQARQDSAQVQNPVEGLANSARSLAHYVSKQYQANLDNVIAQNANINHQSDILKSEARIANWQSSHAKVDADIANIEANMRREALEDLSTKYIKDGDGVYKQVLDKDSKYYKDFKKGISSSAALNASQYWRANAQTAFQGINSASNLMNVFRKPLRGLRSSFTPSIP